MTELKPCPFCGGESVTILKDYGDLYQTRCARCGASGKPYHVRKNAIDCWNKRADDLVPVVRCKDCVNHDSCTVENTFKFARMENGYCAAGKRRDSDGRPVNPERIPHIITHRDFEDCWEECSICGWRDLNVNDKFCPNCFVKFEG